MYWIKPVKVQNKLYYASFIEGIRVSNTYYRHNFDRCLFLLKGLGIREVPSYSLYNKIKVHHLLKNEPNLIYTYILVTEQR